MQLYSIDDVKKFFGVSERTIWRWRKEEGFPAPIYLTKTTPRWKEEDINGWIESKASKDGSRAYKFKRSGRTETISR